MLARLRDIRVVLGLIALGALAVRVIVILAAYKNLPLGLDDNNGYHIQANLFADHFGFYEPFVFLNEGQLTQSAGHPPLYTMYLSITSLVGLDTPLAHRFAGAVAGSAAVVVIGLLARYAVRLTRPEDPRSPDRACIAAALLAAVYPNLWINDGLILSESLYAGLIAVVIMAALWLWKDPGPKPAVALGAAIAAAALTRSEGATLLLFLAVPLGFVLTGRSVWERVRLIGLVGLVALAGMAPWIAFNMARFDKPVFLASGSGRVLAYANCDRTYSGDFLGYWHSDCTLRQFPEGDESIIDEAHRELAQDYVDDHLDEQPKVVAARVGRIWGVFRPFQGIRLDTFYERRGLWPSRFALAGYYVLVPMALAGLVFLRRRRVTIVPFIAPFAMVTFTAAISFGVTRYRVPAEAALAALAGVTVDVAWRAWLRHRSGRAPKAEPDRADAPRELSDALQ